jgi:hypothetical protein
MIGLLGSIAIWMPPSSLLMKAGKAQSVPYQGGAMAVFNRKLEI